ncbi:hypothetical protein AC1031_022087 [Aphanomyces cochlioides]|nr:hypothetical protein AC1031_022087 [Aphanomyces cochlioides]
MRFQPPNSPDLNVLDLGYFRALQFAQFEHEASNLDELIRAVNDTFDGMDITTSENVFLTLQSVMISILEVNGYNNYKMPHLGKAQLRRLGQLPVSLTIRQSLLTSCTDRILEYEMQALAL